MDDVIDLSRPPPFQAHFITALDQLEQNEGSFVFARPLQTSQFPNYDDVVAQPMDYSTMRKKIRGYHYRSFDQFLHDFQLILNNCFAYFPEVSTIHEAALIARQESSPIMEQLQGNIARVTGECPQILQSSISFVTDKAPHRKICTSNELETEGNDNSGNNCSCVGDVSLPCSTKTIENVASEILQNASEYQRSYTPLLAIEDPGTEMPDNSSEGVEESELAVSKRISAEEHEAAGAQAPVIPATVPSAAKNEAAAAGPSEMDNRVYRRGAKLLTRTQIAKLSNAEKCAYLLALIEETHEKKLTAVSYKKLQALCQQYKRIRPIEGEFLPLERLPVYETLKRGWSKKTTKKARPKKKQETLSEVIQQLGKEQRAGRVVAIRSCTSPSKVFKPNRWAVLFGDKSAPPEVTWRPIRNKAPPVYDEDSESISSEGHVSYTSEKSKKSDERYANDEPDGEYSAPDGTESSDTADTNTVLQSPDHSKSQRFTRKSMILRNSSSNRLRQRPSFSKSRRSSRRLNAQLSSNNGLRPSCVSGAGNIICNDSDDEEGNRVCRRQTKVVATRKTRQSRLLDPSAVSRVNIGHYVLRGGRTISAPPSRKRSNTPDSVSTDSAVLKPCVVKLEPLNASALRNISPEISLVDDSAKHSSSACSETNSSFSSMPVLMPHDPPVMSMKQEVPKKDEPPTKCKKHRLPFWSRFTSRTKRRLLSHEKNFVREIAKKENLISVMQKHPELSNLNLKESKDEMPYKYSWQNVAYDLEDSVTKVKKHWSVLRNDFRLKYKKIYNALPRAHRTPEMVARAAWTEWNLFHEMMYMSSAVNVKERPSSSKSLKNDISGLNDACGKAVDGLAQTPWRLPTAAPRLVHSAEENNSNPSLFATKKCKQKTRRPLKRKHESGSSVDKETELAMFGKRISELASQLSHESSVKCMKVVTGVLNSFMENSKEK